MQEETIVFESRSEMERLLEVNRIKQLRINDEVFSIVRTRTSVYVFEKACPHMDYPLINAHVNTLEEVACPLHGYRFLLKSGDESDNRCRPLQVWPTHWNDAGQLILDPMRY